VSYELKPPVAFNPVRVASKSPLAIEFDNTNPRTRPRAVKQGFNKWEKLNIETPGQGVDDQRDTN
jgi:hypothetical protein